MTTSPNIDSDITEFAEKIGLKTIAGREALRVAVTNLQLLDTKQQDYGPKNISSFGMFGVIVRMNDKFERLKNLFVKKRKPRVKESIIDNLRDISNYAVISILLDEGKWPENETNDEDYTNKRKTDTARRRGLREGDKVQVAHSERKESTENREPT